MKIFYWSTGWNNFGDELNPWLIPRMLPRIQFDEQEDEYYVGIGTLLNTRLPKQGIKYVMGSGVGYGEPPVLDDSYRMYGVRGPLSCRALGLDESRYALTDPAMLVPKLFTETVTKTSEVAYMSHCQSDSQADWASIARSAGMDYISPMDSVESVIRKIAGTKLLVTEALHGAILADAFRIPWVPMTSNDLIFEFKWHDWLATIGLEYKPHKIHEIIDGRGTTWVGRQKDNIKRTALRLGMDGSGWTPPGKPLTNARQLAEVQETLARLSRGDQAILSSDAACAAAIARVEAACEALQQDYARTRESVRSA